MPIYEFKCNQCENTFETLVLGRDVPSCSACGSQDLSRLLSTCGFVTRGAGTGDGPAPASPSSGSSCSGCSATSCATCTTG